MANHRISSVFLTLEHQAENPSDCRSEIQARQPSTIFPAPSDPSMVGATAKPTRSSDHGAAIGACLPPDQRVDPTISGRAIPITIDQGSSKIDRKSQGGVAQPSKRCSNRPVPKSSFIQTQIEHGLGSSTFNLLRQIWAATPRAAPWLSLCNPISFQANPETHSSPTSTSTRRSMATKPIPTQQRAISRTASFNLDPESVDHPAASTFRSSKSGRPSTVNERRLHPIFHGRPSQEDARLAPRSSRSRSPRPPAAVRATTKNPTSDPWQPEKKPKISSRRRNQKLAAISRS
ncbi:hypothetical protein ACLOJK_035017, partial [Asimina triloba]